MLTLGHNRLSEIPSSVVTLAALRELALPHNAVATLPSGLGGMTSLEELNLDENGIVSLEGVEFGRMSALRTLLLRRNALRSLPEALLSASGVNKLELEGNAITYRAMLVMPGVEAYNARRKGRIDRALAGDVEADRTYCGLDKSL